MKSIKKIVFAGISIISLILVLSLKSVPSGQLWKNYNILYVPVDSDDNIVVSEISKSEIEGAVILSKQYLPVMLSENSAEIAMYRLNSTLDDFAYALNRNAYFYDKAQNYRLYYIPSQYQNKLSHLISELNSKGIQAGIDSTTSYPWFLPIICAAIAVVLAIFSANTILFGCSAVIPVLFVFCNPFYTAALAVVILLLGLFFVSNIWGRRGFVNVLITNIIIPVMATVSVVSAFACTVKSGIMFIFCLIGSVCVILTYSELKVYFDSKSIFVPVYIRSAKRVSLFADKSKLIMRTVTGTAAGLMLLFVFTSSDSVNAHFAKLQLPSAKGFSTDLPDLEDYCEWTWNVKSYPYRSLNKKSKNDRIEFSRFTEKDGLVIETVQSMSYDEEYKKDVVAQIDELPFNSIEKVMKIQNKDFHPGYAASSSYHTGIFGIIMNLLCLFVLLFIYISIIIRKGARK